MTEPHRPHYTYCPEPDDQDCCGHPWPIDVVCVVDGQWWPCSVKRSHHTPAQVARVQRWADGRVGRPPMVQRRRSMDYPCGRCDKTFKSERVRDNHVTAVHTIAQAEPQPRPEQGDPGNPRGDGRQS